MPARRADLQDPPCRGGRVPPARLCHHARSVGGRTADDSRAAGDPRAPAGWWTTAHPADHVGGDKAYSSRRNRRHLRRRQNKHTIPEPRDQRANRQRRAAKAAAPQGSTRRSTAAATKSSGLSTGSRTSESSPGATTRGRTSSRGRSPWPRFAYGSARGAMLRSEVRCPDSGDALR